MRGPSKLGEQIPYERRRNPNLPWGYWCIATEGQHGITDETGQHWNSLREYLWCDRLGMVRGSAREFDQQCELLLAVLAAIARRVVHVEERVVEFFGGSWEVTRHYACWLEAQGLVETGFSGGITPEGHAILVMLASTRGAGAAPIPIGLPVIAPQRGYDWGATRDERERVIAANMTFTRGLPNRFERTELGDEFGIRLMGLPEGPNVPLARVLWALSFEDGHARDRFFVWAINRLDRWQAWADIARRNGAQALSEHFLALAHADRPALDSG